MRQYRRKAQGLARLFHRLFGKKKVVLDNAKGLGKDEKPQLEIDVTENRVWISINRVTVGYAKDNFIALIRQSQSFKKAIELRVKTF